MIGESAQTTTWRYRLLGIGRMPSDLRDALLADGVPRIVAEGVPARLRRDGSVPGLVRVASVRSYSGAFGISEKRIVVSLGSARILNLPWAAAREVAGQGGQMLIESSGVRITMDVGEVVGGSGSMIVELKCAISDSVLRSLPASTSGIAVAPAAVESLFRRQR